MLGMTVKGMAEFRANINQWKKVIPIEINSYVATLSEFGLQFLTDITQDTATVDSGAYLVSHMVVNQNGLILWESSNRPHENEIFSPRKPNNLPPLFEVVDSITNEARYRILTMLQDGPASVMVINLRPYSDQIEYGSIIVQPPRRIYGTAEDRVYAELERLSRNAMAVSGMFSSTQSAELGSTPRDPEESKVSWNIYNFPDFKDLLPKERYFSSQMKPRTSYMHRTTYT